LGRREFREDLLFRVNVLTIELPPLRSHPEDLPTLINRILSKISKRATASFSVEPTAIKRLQKYPRPGNIRELENALERATAWANSALLTGEDFNFLSSSAPNNRVATEIVTTEAGSASSLVGSTLAEIERRAILETLAHCEGNKAEAARLLGVSLKTIYNKLEKLGLSSPSSIEDHKDAVKQSQVREKIP